MFLRVKTPPKLEKLCELWSFMVPHSYDIHTSLHSSFILLKLYMARTSSGPWCLFYTLDTDPSLTEQVVMVDIQKAVMAA
jgi:hypothetical protein